MSAIIEKANSEARGHQAGKQALQQELDRSRIELDQLRTSLAQAGGESRAIAEARTQLEAEIERLRQRVPLLEGELEQLKSTQPELLGLRERAPQLEASLVELQQRFSAAEESRIRARVLFGCDERQAESNSGLATALSSRRGASCEARLATLQQQLLDAETRAAQLGESLSQYQDERPALGTGITELRIKVNVLEKRLAEAERTAPQSDAEESKRCVVASPNSRPSSSSHASARRATSRRPWVAASRPKSCSSRFA